MYSFRDGQVRISRYLNTKSPLPKLVNRDSTSDVEDKFFDTQMDSLPQIKSYQLTVTEK